MANVSIEEMLALTKEISSRDVTIKEQQLTINQLTEQLNLKDGELEEMRNAMADLRAQFALLEQKLNASEAFNIYCKTYLMLQKEKVKRIFGSLHDISISSLFYMFIVRSLPDNVPKEVITDLTTMADVKDKPLEVKNIFEKDSHCVVANGEVKDNQFGI